ncbi:hypothetical protein [Polaromonas sp. LjRoot131]|jgi:hypothetical protein|uniref:hypothetical protein n=1 Tax=Polaromonas sp. LjRoot131 TaxID=3342262 RepID=UPI003ECF38BC
MLTWIVGALGVAVLMLMGVEVRRIRQLAHVLRKKESAALAERFGARRQGSTNDMLAAEEALKWYRPLREKPSTGHLGDEQGGLFFVYNDMLLADSEGHYWHCLATTTMDQHEKPKLVLTNLSELRARRALFNDPAAYLAAFGNRPEKSDLSTLSDTSVMNGISAEN